METAEEPPLSRGRASNPLRIATSAILGGTVSEESMKAIDQFWKPFMARKLGETGRVIVASPDYLGRRQAKRSRVSSQNKALQSHSKAASDDDLRTDMHGKGDKSHNSCGSYRFR